MKGNIHSHLPKMSDFTTGVHVCLLNGKIVDLNPINFGLKCLANL